MRLRRRKKTDSNGLAAARAEREKSEQRLEAVRRHIVAPLQEKNRHNQFADYLRALGEGGRQ